MYIKPTVGYMDEDDCAPLYKRMWLHVESGGALLSFLLNKRTLEWKGRWYLSRSSCMISICVIFPNYLVTQYHRFSSGAINSVPKIKLYHFFSLLLYRFCLFFYNKLSLNKNNVQSSSHPHPLFRFQLTKAYIAAWTSQNLAFFF